MRMMLRGVGLAAAKKVELPAETSTNKKAKIARTRTVEVAN